MLSKLKLLVLICFFIPSLLLAQSVSCKLGACIPTMLQSISPLNEAKLNSAADNLLNKDAFPKGDRKAARKLNEDALKQLNAGNVQAAIALLKQAVETDPSDVEISSNYGFALLKSSNYVAAQNSLSKTLELNPRRTSTWLPLAEAYAGSGQALIAKQAGLIAFFYSTDKEKAQAYYQKQSQEQSIAPIKAMYVSLVGDIGNQQTSASSSQPVKAAPPQAPLAQAPAPTPAPKKQLTGPELTARAANALGPDGWGKCSSARIAITALSIRDQSMPAQITKANDELGTVLGQVRQYYLANGMPDSALGQYIRAWTGRITSGDQALEIMTSCRNTMTAAWAAP